MCNKLVFTILSLNQYKNPPKKGYNKPVTNAREGLMPKKRYLNRRKICVKQTNHYLLKPPIF